MLERIICDAVVSENPREEEWDERGRRYCWRTGFGSVQPCLVCEVEELGVDGMGVRELGYLARAARVWGRRRKKKMK